MSSTHSVSVRHTYGSKNGYHFKNQGKLGYTKGASNEGVARP